MKQKNDELHIPDRNPDLQKLVKMKYVRLFGRWAIWAVTLTILEIIWFYDYFTDRMNELSAAIIAAFLYILPFFLMKGHLLLADRAWEGTITDIVYDRVVKVNGGDRRKIAYNYEATLTIENGGDYRFYVLPCTGASMRYTYKVGDRIRKYAGLRYPVFIEIPEGLNQICPVCGHDVEENLTNCLKCGASAIHLS